MKVAQQELTSFKKITYIGLFLMELRTFVVDFHVHISNNLHSSKQLAFTIEIVVLSYVQRIITSLFFVSTQFCSKSINPVNAQA